jgi:hypothetical protein
MVEKIKAARDYYTDVLYEFALLHPEAQPLAA